jgi:D-sedoheptulose 7-phosphate isomerase
MVLGERTLPVSDTDVAPSARYATTIAEALTDRRAAFSSALGALVEQQTVLGELAATLVTTLRAGGKVLVAGNGGSAAEAQHFTAELVGRFKLERDPYAVIALTTDTAILTAVANDYGYADVFARQVRGLGRRGDVLVAFSTSGESENLVRAAEAARQCQMTVAAMTGSRPSRLARAADLAVLIPLADTAAIQELHMLVTHLLCSVVEMELAASAEGGRS